MEVSSRPHSSVVGAVRMGLRSAGLDERHSALDDAEPRIVMPRLERRAQYDEGFARYLDHYSRTLPGAGEAAR
jgi:gluconokinase